MPASVAVTLRALVGTLEDENLPLRRVRDDAGLVETEYFEFAESAPRSVRLTFVVEPDTLGRGAQLAAFAFTRTGDAEEPVERALAPDHPASGYVKRLIEQVERRAIGL